MKEENEIVEYERYGDTPYEEGEPGMDEEKLKRITEYHYFDGAAIFKSMKLNKRAVNEGKRLIDEKKIRMQEVNYGYGGYRDEIFGEGLFQGTDDEKRNFGIRIQFSRDGHGYIECRCPKCGVYYYSSWNQKDCEYIAAASLILKQYLLTHNLGDATDRTGGGIISTYMNRKSALRSQETFADQEQLSIEPRLIYQDNKLWAAFKAGNHKKFVIKNIFEFYDKVRKGEMATFGTKTTLNVAAQNFDEASSAWLGFIGEIVSEEEVVEQRLIDSNAIFHNSKYLEKRNMVSLHGRRLDQFYDLVKGTQVELDNREVSKKKNITFGEADPGTSIQIQHYNDKKGVFQGIDVTCKVPNLFRGRTTAYFIHNDQLNKVSEKYMEDMTPLLEQQLYGHVQFRIGRNKLQNFYYHILPVWREHADIMEENPEVLDAYLLPEGKIIYYLDVRDGNAVCRLRAKYGETEYSVTEGVYDKRKRQEPFRNAYTENEAYEVIARWLPGYDAAQDELHCDGQEERIYQLMRDGLTELMKYGEVQCTNRFRNLSVVRKMKLSVGVSIESNLMELNISSEGVDTKELLDILKSYREKKKYHILKNGEFIDLEENNIQMLAEVMATLQVPVKEFLKGKMHIPLYRALYLEKMLEENETVYSHRDSRFRSLIKNFKAVSDADFDEPESLKKIMRKYQIKGYKWLRTLENYGFGGILADDMGLGKTLQVISMLLAAKQESKNALIVTPASLVYNWGAELEKFAPELQYALVTGSQQERYEIIQKADDYDVLVTSYDLLKRDIVHYEDRQFYYEIIDEAQYIKNHTTAAAKSVKVIHSRNRFALTGTPIENRLSELWSIFDYLMPGFLYPYETFRKEFETPIVKNDDKDAMERLKKMIAPFVLRRRKEEVLKELPDKLEECCYVKMEGTQQKLYDAQVVHMKQKLASQSEEEFQKGGRIQILAELTKLRQICCDPELCFENYDGASAKKETCMDLLNSAMEGGHKILLFSQFTSMLDLLKAELDAQKIPYYCITGQTPKAKRMEMVKAFNEDDTKVFLISLKAGGVGLNLTGADVVIHYDPWWNVAAQNQATDRAHRIGQTKKVTVYKLIVKKTIEEKIQKLQESKRDLADQVLSGEGAQLSSMTKEELMELLG